MQEIIDILKTWIDFARARGLTDKAKEFWLLWDFAAGDMDDNYYKKHHPEAVKILSCLDLEKPQCKIIYDSLIEVVKKYE